jgi:hypothetical protein
MNEFKIKNGLIVSGSADIEQNLTVRGTLTADQYNVSIVSTSILYESGSTKFGDTSDDTHEFTGSVLVNGKINASSLTGSLNFNNLTNVPTLVSGSSQISYTGITNVPSGIVSGSEQLTGSYDTRYVLSGSITQTTWDNIANKPGGLISGSIQVDLTGTTGYSTFSSSVSTSIGSLSSSVATTHLNQNNRLNSIEGKSGSYATTGSNTFIGSQTITGSINLTSKLLVGDYANTTTYPTASIIGSNVLFVSDIEDHNIGIVGAGLANNSISGSTLTGWGVGGLFKGWTHGYTRSAGVLGEGMVSASSDVGASTGVRGYAIQPHIGGLNIGLYGDAASGSANYALYMNRGDIYSPNPQKWVLGNSVSALDIQNGLLNFDTANSAISSSGIITAKSFTGSLFTGSFKGDGSQLYNIPASGVTGLNLNKIISGSVSASISPDKGLEINTNTIISGALSISGITTLGGSIVPLSPRGATLGTLELPFADIFVSSGSINIAGIVGQPNTTLSNVSGNILISAGGMQLIGSGAFNAETGSFQFISGSMEQIGNYTQTGNYTMTGNKTITGSLNVTGDIQTTGNIIAQQYIVSSSVTYLTTSFSSGSTKFGDSIDDTHQFTGSVLISGSIVSTTTPLISGSSQITYSGLTGIPSGIVSGSVQVVLTGTTGYSTFSSSVATTTLEIKNRVDSIESKTGSYATTGSNVFIGNQTITGSVNITGSLSITGLTAGATTDSIVTYNPTTKAVGSITGITASQIPTRYYGAFYDLTTQTGSTNVSGSVILGNTQHANGVSVVSGSRVTVANAGVYNLQFSTQLYRSQGGTTVNTYFWFRINGVNVTNSSTIVSTMTNNNYTVASWNYVDVYNAGDYVELMWMPTGEHVSLVYVNSPAGLPSIPSVILTLTQV